LNTITYLNEYLLPGQIGHFATLLAFVAAMLSAFAFFMATWYRANTAQYVAWRRVGRWAFAAQTLGIVTTMACIFYVLIEHRYEYHFAFKVVNEQLPFKYIFSAFWQEQEGSFLLWLFWHSFMGCLLIWTAKEWETPVLATLALIQVVLLTMLLGLYFPWGTGEFHIGSNPLRLLRDAMPNSPIFNRPDYLTKIKGRGLNPLLQNWWMTIHPPTLFYGFASTSIPFCFAVAGLWLRKHTEWVRAALPWALMSGAVLGTGILMGGAWAYEALSFGGYWAWDPVENMSLVPWLTLVAAIHSMLIAKATGRSLKSAYFFSIITFVLITYSTFLTRSGILGDTSVHAFTEMGLEWQLVGFIVLFAMIGFGLLAFNFKNIQEPEKEESLYSKEFWVFIGTLVLFFSTILITFTTSIPVYNKILTYCGNTFHFAVTSYMRRPPLDAIGHYNQYQVWIGMLMGLLSGFAQFLRWKEISDKLGAFWVRTGITFGASLIIGLLIAYLAGFAAWQYWVLMVTSVYAILCNIDYIYKVSRHNLKMLGSALSHIGFALLFIGAVFSGANKEQISADSFMKVSAKAAEGFTEDDAAKNVLLYKGLPTQMANYELTYVKDTVDNFTRFFTVHYKHFDKKGDDKKVIEEFDLRPDVLYTIDKDKVAASNPSTKHYWTKDIFTHIVSLPIDQTDPMAAQPNHDSISFKQHELKERDTIFTSKNYIVYTGLQPAKASKEYTPEPNDIAVAANLEVRSIDDNTVRELHPLYVIRDNMGIGSDAELKDLGIVVRFDKIDGFKQKVFISVGETAPKKDFIVLSAIVFPGINLVWLGCTLMMFGLAMAMVVRIREKQ
jgi:cytochrome c-type biogenesis protein CcmF